MNNICVKLEGVSKRFFVLKRRHTLLSTARALIKHEGLKRELWVLRDVSFEIANGEKVALIGKNGSGKTTLLRILTGIYDKTAGDLKVKSPPMALFRLLIGLNGLLPVVDNIYLIGALYGIHRDILKDKEDEILKIAGLKHLEFSPLKMLSVGQQHRLALSVFFQAKNDFFIFDESTAFVDLEFVHICDEYFKKLFSSETTVIMTSHDEVLLKKYCDTAIWLDEGRICMRGPSGDVIDAYSKYYNA